jgi:cytochrome P450
LEHPTELKKGRDYAFFEQWLGRGLLLSDGQQWREQRKTLTPTFHFAMLNQYTAIFNGQARTLVGNLAKLEGQDKQEDIGPLLTRCSLDIIGGKFLDHMAIIIEGN